MVPVLLFLVTFVIRLTYCFTVNPVITQISDFETLLKSAVEGLSKIFESELYYADFPHKFFYPFFLHNLGVRTQSDMLLVNCILVSGIPVILYSIGKRI